MAPQIRKLLFTSDLSETSKHAFSYALSLASCYKAEVVFLHVMHEIDSGAKIFLNQEMLESSRREIAQEARATLTGKRLDMAAIQSGLKKFLDLNFKDQTADAALGADVIVAEGDVVDLIIQTAREQSCDTIVLGSRRRGALSEVMFGSVVKGVLRKSNCLVIVAPPLPKK